MRLSPRLVHVVALLCLTGAAAPRAQTAPAVKPTADWPVWGGPNRNFLSPATGLLSSWPASGPPKLWTRALGEGHSASAIEGRRLYTMYSNATGEVVAALDAATGKTLWEHAYKTAFADTGGGDIGNGPFAMPQVVGERLVTVGGTGRLYSLEKRTGRPVWTHDLYAEFGASPMRFGYSCHALPYKDLLIMSIGGSGKSLIAFNQTDGKVVWAKHSFPNSHSSPLLITVDGQPQVVALMGQQVVAVDPTTGNLLWTHSHPTQYDLAISTPSWGPDNILVVSSSYEGGTRALHLTQAGGKTTVKQLWHNPRIRVHFGTMIRVGGTIYGASGHDGPAPITAFDVKTGQVLWHSGREFAKAQLVYADGKLIVLDQDGVLALATPTPTALTVQSKVPLLTKVAWAPPVLAGNTLYIRDRKTLMALKVGA
jgi:outer membrane protein assembly factor BamB